MNVRASASTTTALVLCALALAAPDAHAYDYPRVARLEPNVAFWQKVYVTWSVDDIALHDTEDFKLVYRVVRVPPRGEKRGGVTRAQAISKASEETRAALARLDKKRPTTSDGLDDVEREIFDRLKSVTRADKYAFASRVRAQNGLRERFLAGYRTAGAWEPEVRARLKDAGLPEDLVALAYVESLMTIRAKSHAGAVGIWQFMPATGREYMHVNSVVDERMDPILATDAAAKYINTALKSVGPWPVAITSYNYGRGGMKRAIDDTGSKDLGVILERYKHGRFGFAARNYYASFLAVHDVLHAPERFLGKTEQRAAWSYDTVRLPFPATTAQLVGLGIVDKETLVFMNPALTDAARESREALPRGLPLRIPAGKGARFVDGVVAIAPKERAKAERLARVTHKANGKETPAIIAKNYGVPVDVVASMAGVSSSARVPKGKLLALPSNKQRYSLFPGARSLGIPDSPALDESVRIAALAEPPPPAPSTTTKPEPPAPKPTRVAKADQPSKGIVKAKVTSRTPIKDKGARVADAEIFAIDATTSALDAFLPDVDALSGVANFPVADDASLAESDDGRAIPTS